MSVIRQLSLFGADASVPEPADLAGLLVAGGVIAVLTVDPAGPGSPGRPPVAPGTQPRAQVAVEVAQPWRAAVLVTECARRGLAATCVSTDSEFIAVRTEHSERLATLATTWAGGRVPRELLLTGAMLRLWAAAHGRRAGVGYELPLGPMDELSREVVGGSLAAIGLAAQLVSPRGGGHPSYRIVGTRRLARLAELVGDPPKQAPADIWPS